MITIIPFLNLVFPGPGQDRVRDQIGEHPSDTNSNTYKKQIAVQLDKGTEGVILQKTYN